MTPATAGSGAAPGSGSARIARRHKVRPHLRFSPAWIAGRQCSDELLVLLTTTLQMAFEGVRITLEQDKLNLQKRRQKLMQHRRICLSGDFGVKVVVQFGESRRSAGSIACDDVIHGVGQILQARDTAVRDPRCSAGRSVTLQEYPQVEALSNLLLGEGPNNEPSIAGIRD